MESIATQNSVQHFIGYFEEPEPGVPDGCTGWYHSGGKFPVHSAEQIFTIGENARSVVREEAAGPFACRSEALADLQLCLSD